jgi:hypothetical protein
MNPEHRQLVEGLLEIQHKMAMDDYVPSEQHRLDMLADCVYIRTYLFPANLNVSDSIRILSLVDLVEQLQI